MGGWKMQPVINKKWYGKCLEIVLKLRFRYILEKIITVRERSTKSKKRFKCLDSKRYNALLLFLDYYINRV